ncbi:MAG: hypothetical protein Q7R56_03565 [Nanoarchaeota archaeon]|nr:hypothetical protein [Nanoarchaeota archaeon]
MTIYIILAVILILVAIAIAITTQKSTGSTWENIANFWKVGS